MHVEVPHRPVTGGVFGVSDRHSMPQPLVACPLRWWLGCVPLRHIRQRLPGLPRRQQVPQGLAVLVLERQGTDVAQVQAQPGQLVLCGRHLPVPNEDNVLQRQKVRQLDMFAEGRELRNVRRAIPGAAMQRVEPHRQATIASG